MPNLAAGISCLVVPHLVRGRSFCCRLDWKASNRRFGRKGKGARWFAENGTREIIGVCSQERISWTVKKSGSSTLVTQPCQNQRTLSRLSLYTRARTCTHTHTHSLVPRIACMRCKHRSRLWNPLGCMPLIEAMLLGKKSSQLDHQTIDLGAP